jgi:hypothetical protein
MSLFRSITLQKKYVILSQKERGVRERERERERETRQARTCFKIADSSKCTKNIDTAMVEHYVSMNYFLAGILNY